MKKIYDASNKEKGKIIDTHNEIYAFDKWKYSDIGIKDMVLLGRTKTFPTDGKVDITWHVNSIDNNKENGEVIIIEPLKDHMKTGELIALSATNAKFFGEIELSKKAIFLMPTKMYNEEFPNKRRIRLYEGEEKLAVKMLMYDKDYVFIPTDKDRYIIDKKEFPDMVGFIETIIKKQDEINKNINNIEEKNQRLKSSKKSNNKKENNTDNSKEITGLTEKVEGTIQIDDDLYASTDIGKRRENQEDAVLLMKNSKSPNLKMMVVADGMGGWSKGEIASDIIINKLRDWFESLSDEQIKEGEENVEAFIYNLQKKIEEDIQDTVSKETLNSGGSTLVCAIIGKNNTLITNIGDSRAYIAKNKKITQLSREDTIVYEKFKKGKFESKEVSRFDRESNVLTQCIGMNKRDLKHPYIQVINNNEYDMILLFSDGVTDCLSDEDIAVVCRNSDKKEITKKIVEKAIKNDSIIDSSKILENENLIEYIPGGKDNLTAAVYISDTEERE